jgi:23S rRNA (cytosine1962-C5)-methyltransferase
MVAPDLGLGQVVHRLARVQRMRRKWARRTGATCWRVFDHDLPDQPIIVDWYDGDAVVWTGDRTRNETPDQRAAWEQGAAAAAATGLGLDPHRVWLKRRRRQRGRHQTGGDRAGDGQYEPDARRGVVRTVRENGLSFTINLSDYLDVGLFLDHRPLRARVGAEAAGRRVLNLFAYTGAFTVHARAGGAAATCTVDLSNTYLAWAERNLAANGLGPSPDHTVVRADCLGWLDAVVAGGPRWDVIVCDPPTFSASTAMHGRTWSVTRDQAWLLDRLRRIVRPDGVIWFSTNARGFRLDPAAVGDWIADDVSAWSVPDDMRDRRIHQCWRITARPPA